MNTQPLKELMPRAEAMHLALIDTVNLEGLILHSEDRAVLDAWACHALNTEEAIERLHTLLDAEINILTPEQRQTRALAAFPTLRLAELQCYGLDQLPPSTTAHRIAVHFPPLTPEDRKVYNDDEIPDDYDGYLIPIRYSTTQEEINQLPEYCFRSATQRVVRMPDSFFNLKHLPHL